MGQDFRECWASAWPVIGEAFERAVRGETSYLENQRMFLDRNGYLEETFFTFSFSPIRDETGGVGGLFHPVTETTGNMLSERRTRALRDLAARTGKAQTHRGGVHRGGDTRSRAYALDLPFVLLYELDGERTTGRLVAGAGLTPGTAGQPAAAQSGRTDALWGAGAGGAIRRFARGWSTCANAGMALPADPIRNRPILRWRCRSSLRAPGIRWRFLLPASARACR